MKTRVIQNSRIPKLLSWFIPIKAITIGPFIFVDGEPSETLLSHEMIHVQQYKELWYVGFLFLYLMDWVHGLLVYRNFREAYRAIRFEQEARYGEKDSGYLSARQRFAWKSFSVRAEATDG